MRYRRLGQSGVKVSEVSLGSWLTYGGSVEEQVARECIHAAMTAGVNFFDTANIYALGRSEEVVGAALREYPRDSYVLATKVYFPMGPGPNDRGLSRKHVLEQCDHSLQRLGVDYVDLYQCHRFDEETPVEETARAMDDLVRTGKILYWGVSEWNSWQVDEVVELCHSRGWTAPVSNQPQYNALYRRIEHGVLDATARAGMGNVVWSPLAMGVLTGKYADAADRPSGSRAAGDAAGFMGGYLEQPVLDAVQQACAACRDAGFAPATVALAWCLRRSEVSSVIIGASHPSQLVDTLAAGDVEVPGDVLERFDEALAAAQVHA